ncbi:uncharacterized protein LOC131681048 [Topomyia yanbarensis]|uniref:uncharacterized protein LOC131681048 n=1 Tax=Topomyia yanbarensis TaxID=2498891 RepID=UPI00273B0A59|nr:uncharacterized protein LOC131681048 [Topomyia yanbarensis]
MISLRKLYRNFLHFDMNSDQCKYLAKLHKLVGCNLTSPLAIRIWRVSFVLSICHALCFCYRLYMVIEKDFGFPYIVCAFNVIGGYVSGAVRMSGFINSYNDFRKFRQFMVNSSIFQRDSCEAQRIRRENYQNNQKFSVFMFIAGFSAIFIWNMTDYRATDQYRIPFELAYLDPPVKATVETVFGLYLLQLAAYFWIPFITTRVTMRILQAELMVVNMAYEGLFYNAMKSSKFFSTLIATSSTSNLKHTEKQLFWVFLERELRTIVAHHKELLINVYRIRKLASWSFLAEVFASVLIASIGVFMFMLVREESLVLVGISCLVMLESYYNSSLVEDLEDTHLATKEALYQLEWPSLLQYDRMYVREYKYVRRTILIVMMRSQHRLNFHCGGLFEMSMQTFSATVKTCYTILTFLMRVQGF